jgi:hypothetical protein
MTLIHFGLSYPLVREGDSVKIVNRDLKYFNRIGMVEKECKCGSVRRWHVRHDDGVLGCYVEADFVRDLTK